MKIAVLGTGVAGQTIAGKLQSLGHDVMMGARSSDNEKAVAFKVRTGGRAGAFADAAAHGELIFNCTRGDATMAVLHQAGEANLADKVLIDVSNPLDFSKGFPPTLTVSNTDSLAEMIQREFPSARVVKTLNTVTASVMIEPRKLPGAHTMFVSGNDAAAKGRARDFLTAFGWTSIIDLGDITGARAQEQYLPLWIRLYGTLGNAEFNIAVVKV
jgi:predicted dinucleotide-binding enzyme